MYMQHKIICVKSLSLILTLRLICNTKQLRVACNSSSEISCDVISKTFLVGLLRSHCNDVLRFNKNYMRELRYNLTASEYNQAMNHVQKLVELEYIRIGNIITNRTNSYNPKLNSKKRMYTTDYNLMTEL